MINNIAYQKIIELYEGLGLGAVLGGGAALGATMLTGDGEEAHELAKDAITNTSIGGLAGAGIGAFMGVNNAQKSFNTRNGLNNRAQMRAKPGRSTRVNGGLKSGPIIVK